MVYAIIAALVVATCGFAPLSILPGWIQGFTTYQPLTQIVDAVRSLLAGGPVHVSAAAWAALAWGTALLFLLRGLVRRSRRVA